MRPFTLSPFGQGQATSTGNANVQSIPVPKGTSAILVSCDTNPARITLDGTAPSSTVGIVIQNTLQPVLLITGSDTVLQFVSNAAAAASTLNAIFLR